MSTKPIRGCTRSVNESMKGSPQMAQAVINALAMFERGDWGNLTEHDKKLNDSIMKTRDGMVQGKYPSPEGSLYIEEVFDEPSVNNDVITIMFCHEH